MLTMLPPTLPLSKYVALVILYNFMLTPLWPPNGLTFSEYVLQFTA